MGKLNDCENNCDDVSEASREIVVKDTLPPVITLTLRKKLIQTSDASKRGVGGEYNPAGRKTSTTHFHNSPLHNHTHILMVGNPFLDDIDTADHESAHRRRGNFMAEQTASNGWLIAAAASAVAGVALMGYSMKTAPITVP